MICLLLGSHIFLTIRTGFIQRKLPTAIKMSLAKDEDAEGDVSQFGALVTALAGTIGTGSIVGVATAIIAGGVQYLRIEGSMYVGIGILFLLYGYYRAVRKPGMRSEERRVGKECRSRWSPYH